MRKLLLFSVLMLAAIAQSAAQRNPIDDLFDKYSGRDGITTVYISSRMLSLFSGITKDDPETSKIIGRLTSIRIISIDDAEMNEGINFYNELGKSVNYKDFEELMVIKEGSDIVKFMIKESGTKIVELLMVTGGTSNSLISIRGDIDLESISKLSSTMGMTELENLERIDKKQEIKK
jgi:hypothetical protein